jgi:hypothetical protein
MVEATTNTTAIASSEPLPTVILYSPILSIMICQKKATLIRPHDIGKL